MNLVNRSIATGQAKEPIAALLNAGGDGVLAVITEVEGASYRPLGAMMAILADESRVGSLSSGCIEADLTLHALNALEGNRPVSVRYGRGSPFADIQLPCGGGLGILLLPRPDLQALNVVNEARAARRPCTLAIDPSSGALDPSADGKTGFAEGRFNVRFLPELRFLVFGKGPEASTFAALVESVGYENVLLSPDTETLEADAPRAHAELRHLVRPEMPRDLGVDAWTAVTLFFHDHEWEPAILSAALDTPAFYIGAQGSQRARDARLAEMRAQGETGERLARLHGPVGLVPSARDPRTLAVSVLAEVLSEAQSVLA